MLFDKEVNIEFTSDFYYILDWCQRLSKDPYYFFIKIFRHHKYVFFLMRNSITRVIVPTN